MAIRGQESKIFALAVEWVAIVVIDMQNKIGSLPGVAKVASCTSVRDT